MDKDIWKPKGTSHDQNVPGIIKIGTLGEKILKRYDSVCGRVHLTDGTCSCIAAIYFVSLK